MARTWEYEGEKPNGQWKLTITTDGRQPQIFYGKSKADIAEQLADAQDSASAAIEELKRSGKTPAPRTPRTAPLSSAERMQLASDITNPGKLDTAVARVIESTVGPISEIQKVVRQDNQNTAVQNAVAAAVKFADETPDWHPSEFNKRTLAGFMKAQNMDPANRAHYTQAFEELKAAGLLQPKPEGETEHAAEPEPIAPKAVQQPTRVSTGIRSSDVSGSTPVPSRRLKYTQEEIGNMSAAKYKQLWQSDPEFSKCVEFYSQPKRRTA